MLRRDLLLAGAGLALGCAPAPARAAASAGTPLAVVRHDDHLRALARALELAGFGAVRSGDRVLVKVNTNSGDPYPYSSSPAAVRWLCQRLRDQGARVTVGDRSFWGDDDTAGNLERNGIAAAARAAGARVLVFDAIDWVEVPPDLVPAWRPPVRVPALALEAERLVSFACLKTHFISGTTLALKNLLGLVHAEDRARPGNLRTHDRARVHEQIAQLHRFVRASVHLIDGHRALCAGGPTPTSGAEPLVRDLGVVVACRDPVAADAAGVALLRRYASADEAVHRSLPWHSPTVAAAKAAGLGASKVTLVHEGLAGDVLAELG